MRNWKSICRRFLFPPLWLVIVLAVISASALTVIFMKNWNYSPIAYAVYTVSFYSLTVVCLACQKTVPGYYRSVRGRVYENKYANRYLTDVSFKIQVNLYRSLIINLLYAAVNAVSAVIYSTYWFGIFAVYYAIMAVMRFLLIRHFGQAGADKSRVGELKRSRLCAYILMTVNLVLSGVILMMIYYGRGFEYRGVLIYVVAAYTFYITTAAIIDIVRCRKYNSPVMSAANMIRLAAALFSMLFLETAMFAQFGGASSPEMQRNMIMAIGAGISVVVVVMSVYMIVHCTKELREIGV